ncbi:MAG: long-chain fatty acid--CoA ligase [Armatimonadota bacterium]|nr:long-chain fatty acid--CoA ligase [Armatimonadota bacterium]
MNDPLARQIADWIDADPAPDDDETFNKLALALFSRQYARNAPYRRLCDGEGQTPDVVRCWQDIPAAPAQAFKVFTLSCVPIEQAPTVFHSSGTTGAQTSKHFMDADGLEIYETSLRRGFELALPHRPARLWALMPPPAESPHSSLSHMLGALGAEEYFWEDDARLAASLHRLSQPVTLFGTAFAFVQLLDATTENWQLPAGSVVIETGGFKGRTREVPREELYGLFQTRLGVPLERCYSEYGMSEMASQFYGRGLNPQKRRPRWVRTRAIDPETERDAEGGQPGLLRHYDLANFNSVLALQTQDRGTLTPQGFVLQGRASEAELRGCSLTVEELWESKSETS